MIVQTELKVICGWCGRVMQDPQTDDFRISHGICPICYDKQMAVLEAMKPHDGKAPDHSVDLGGEG